MRKDDLKNTNELAPALLKAQSKLKGVVKNKQGLFNAKYADLGEIISTIQKPLNDEGIIITQGHDYDVDSDVFYITTTLIHKSGQSMSSKIGFPIVSKTPHAVAGLSTYGRRYGLSAMLGIASLDDDGTQAMGGYVSDDQKHQFDQLINHKSFDSKRAKTKEWWGKIKTHHDAELALAKMKTACDNYDAQEKQDKMDEEMKMKMDLEKEYAE